MGGGDVELLIEIPALGGQHPPTLLSAVRLDARGA
jgi:hypothetical protein